MKKPILFFDGVCSLCNGFVDFVFRNDVKGLFQVASLQGKTAKQNLPEEYIQDLNTFVLLQNEVTYVRSTAVLMVLKELPFPWSFLGSLCYLVPRPIRDFCYKKISLNRYIMFGKKDSCRLPSPEEKNRFLD